MMITAEQALQELFNIAQQSEYHNSASHSVEREFKNSYPVQVKPPFVPDQLPRQIGGSK